MPDIESLTLADMREHLAELVALANTAEKPAPTRYNTSPHSLPGPQWIVPNTPGREDIAYRDHWSVIACTDPEARTDPPAVLVGTPHSLEGDHVAVPVPRARRLAMAVLAACDESERIAAGVPSLAARRRGVDDKPSRPPR